MESPLKHNTKSLEEKQDLKILSASISELLENYRENEWNRKNNEPYESEEFFIQSEAEKILSTHVQPLTQQVEELTREVETRRDAMVNYMVLMDKKEEENKALKSELEELKKERGQLLSDFLNWVEDKTYFFEDKDVTVEQIVNAYLLHLSALNSPVKQGE